MFASKPFRLSDLLRRAGACLKAFALLEAPPALLEAPPARLDGQTMPAAAKTAPDVSVHAHDVSVHAHAARQSPVPAPSHRHRRPPLSRVDRRSPRRPGTVPAGLQPCTVPIAPSRRAKSRQARARCSRSGI